MEERNSAEERGRQIGERLGTTVLFFVPILLVFVYRWISGDEKTDLVQALGDFGWYFYAITMGSAFVGVMKLIVYDFRR